MNEQEAWAIESAGENAVEVYDRLLKNCPLGDADKRRVLKAKAAAEWIEQSGTLIASAPALLDALRDTCRIIQGWEQATPMQIANAADKARAAIARAERGEA